MSSGTTDSLFAPSLEGERTLRPTYSIRSQYFVAFFGGPLAILIFGALGARLLGRLQKDWWLFALIAVGVLLQIYFVTDFLAAEDTTAASARNVRLVNRVISVVWVGVLYLRYRAFHRAIDLTGRDRPNPWKAGLGSIAASIVVGIVVAALMRMGADVAG